jgi:hypothetical protein
LNTAVIRLNRAATLLFRILSVLSDQWNPDTKLPALTKDDLDKSINDAQGAISKLIDESDAAKAIEKAKTGIVHGLAKGAENICVHVKPFL